MSKLVAANFPWAADQCRCLLDIERWIGTLEAPPRDYRSGENGVAASCVPVQITLIERQSGSSGANRDHRKLAPDKIRVIASRLWERIDNTWTPRGSR